MKLKLLCALLGTALSAGAIAAPIALPGGPLFFQFTNVERTDLAVDANGNPLNRLNRCPGCAKDANGDWIPEGNWGVAQVSVMTRGKLSPLGSTPGQLGNDIVDSGAPAFFNNANLPAGAQITAMFYGSTLTSIVQNGSQYTLQSTGGYLDLYWDDASLANSIIQIGDMVPTMRTSTNTFTGVTDGVLLARLAFASGINSTSGTTTIQGDFDRALNGDAGHAESYANVVDVNGDGVIDSNDGLWAGQLNTDWFGTVFGTRDLRFSNRIQTNTAWTSATLNDVIGQTSDDPGRAMVVPEPAGLALVSLGLLGLAAVRRRREV